MDADVCPRCGEPHPTLRDTFACIYQDVLPPEEFEAAWVDRVDEMAEGWA